MRLRTLLGTVAVATTMLCVASAASAEEKGGKRLAIPFAERGLTLGAMILAPEVGFDAFHYKFGAFSDTSVGMEIGARFGILDDLDVRAVAVPLHFTPEFAYGNPVLGAQYRFLKGDFELGAAVNARIPTKTGERFGLEAGLPARLHVGKTAVLDTGAFFLMNGGATESPIAAAVAALGALGGGKDSFGVNIPIRFAIDVVEQAHVGLSTGFSIGDFSDAGSSINIPLGVFGGYVIPGDNGPMLDIDPYFMFPNFATPGSNGDKINANIFQVGVAASYYLYL